ncbi:hypothetical protein E3T55_06485 [Cryobacterium frigoriphilum]|uniref:AbiEi antitoxin N-terminal domain-containing protein n=1 Tax=Cryobacterium frigoriphilum TaxID=1259150 RepID=A0A4V3IRM7_9MICO|nr:type IV toxin-antitoxin system AbiEi family antitoxin domain-containing protein [Cryobacterium frigoriphilum]TFD52249.1 hypothetical protein E3T55_06485 [Cryobacterium frigoriphilum]
MRDILDTVSARYDGLVTFSALRAAGLPLRAVRDLASRGELVRVRRGIYCLGALWREGGVDGRYRLLVRATAAAAEHPLVLSHHSAASMHGLPIIGGWPPAVHTIATDATGGSTARLTTSHRGVPEPDTVVIGGLTVTSLARTLVDVAASSTLLVGVTMIDHVLREENQRVALARKRGMTPAPALAQDALFAELAAVRPRVGAGQAEKSITFSSGLSANPGETLSRVRIFELGFEVPELQVRFQVDGQSFWVDFFWRGIRKIGEFDGNLKYSRGAVLGDRDPGDVVTREKWREDLLRPHVTSFSRWGWDVAYSPQRFLTFLTENGMPRAESGRRAQVRFAGAV